MKRGYILVYMLVIMSILFALVLRLTSRTEESMTTNISYTKSLEERYAYESAGHLALDHFKSKGWFQPYDPKLGRTDVYEIPSEVLKGKEARLTYDKGTITIQVGDEYTPYMTVIRLESQIEETLDNDEDILELIYGSVSESYRDKFVMIEDRLIKNKGKDLEVYTLNKKEMSDSQEIRELTNEEETYLQDDYNEKNEYKEHEENITGENLKQELTDQEGLEINIDEQSPVVREGMKTQEDSNLFDHDELLMETSPSLDEESNEILERVLSFEDYAYYSDNVTYQADGLMFTRGIMEVSNRTKISGRVYHHGIAIVRSLPEIEDGDLRVDGKVINLSQDTSDFIKELPSSKNQAGVLRFFKDQEKIDYELVEFSIR